MAKQGSPQMLERAQFTPIKPEGDGKAIQVHFNPASLQYTLSNTLKEEGSGKKAQFVDKSSAKLSMQLVFDSTDTGTDVTIDTHKLAALLKPSGRGSKQVPPRVEFAWGAYRFTGVFEQYKETLDFFSANGLPLRATVDLTLASQVIEFSAAGEAMKQDQLDRVPEPVVVQGKGPSQLANALGDPRVARAIAASNGAASLRFGGDAGLAVGAGVQLRGEAAFAAGAGIGGGIGFGAGVGFGVGAGVGAGAGAGMSAGMGAGIGAGMSAGLGASMGAGMGAAMSAGMGAGMGLGAGVALAGSGRSVGFGMAGVGIGAAGFSTAGTHGSLAATFSGLRTSTTGPNVFPASLPDPRTLLPSPGASMSTSVNTAPASTRLAQFAVGGRAQLSGTGLTTDVGASIDLNATLKAR